jgi:hypothetical protein
LQGAPEKVEDRIVMRRIRMRRTPAPPMSTPAHHRQSRGFRKNGMPSLYLIAIAAMRLHQQGHFYSASRTIKKQPFTTVCLRTTFSFVIALPAELDVSDSRPS